MDFADKLWDERVGFDDRLNKGSKSCGK